MSYSTWMAVLLASSLASLEAELRERLRASEEELLEACRKFLLQGVTPASTFAFEEALAAAARELARRLAESTFNAAEGGDPQALPQFVRFEAGEYRRLNKKTANREVSTRFGKIVLYRFGYRYRQRESEPAIFPLERALGLEQGATPALADRVARYLAEAGATQGAVLERLRQEHDVGWGTGRLRKLAAAESEKREPLRHACQVARLLQLLQQADESRGKCKPVLAVGRDGITVAKRQGYFEVAGCASVTVYDRRGKRLGSVYLAQMPEAKQGTLSRQLTDLLKGVLAGWQGRLPRLVYVTDAGDNECRYFRRVLAYLRHPRSGRRLAWQRIVDYYHAAQRITTMAEALFGKGRRGASWAARMRKLLKRPGGVSRVLHSAAALRSRQTEKMNGRRTADFNKAYSYLRRRTRFMDYARYQALQLPIGSGVTEAACKTIFTQRLKLSGMRWGNDGGQTILNLRVLLLSGVWDDVRDRMLQSNPHPTNAAHQPHQQTSPQIAA